MKSTRTLLSAAIAATILTLALQTVNAAPRNFRAHLSGGEEVPPNDSRAQGQAIFQLSADGTEVSFRLIVANIENVRAAHIHVAPAGVNGGVGVFLYGGPTIPGRFQGTLSEGVFTAADFIGPLAGVTLEGFLALLDDGQLYVNVHTDQFPGGEVRGQLH